MGQEKLDKSKTTAEVDMKIRTLQEKLDKSKAENRIQATKTKALISAFNEYKASTELLQNSLAEKERTDNIIQIGGALASAVGVGSGILSGYFLHEQDKRETSFKQDMEKERSELDVWRKELVERESRL